MIDPAARTYAKSTGLLTDRFTDEEFEICRKEYIRQLRDRLAILRRREEIQRCEFPVPCLDVEQKFAQLLRLIRPKADYPRNASYINSHFNEQQRRVIYALLEEVIEQAPWHGVSWSTVCTRISEHKAKASKGAR